MSSIRTQLVAEIKTFLAHTGMRPSTFGRMSVNDPALVHKLTTKGRNVGTEMADRLRDFMRKYRAPPSMRPRKPRGRRSSRQEAAA